MYSIGNIVSKTVMPGMVTLGFYGDHFVVCINFESLYCTLETHRILYVNYLSIITILTKLCMPWGSYL